MASCVRGEVNARQSNMLITCREWERRKCGVTVQARIGQHEFSGVCACCSQHHHNTSSLWVSSWRSLAFGRPKRPNRLNVYGKDA